MKRLKNVRTEMALSVLAYNLTLLAPYDSLVLWREGLIEAMSAA